MALKVHYAAGSCVIRANSRKTTNPSLVTCRLCSVQAKQALRKAAAERAKQARLNVAEILAKNVMSSLSGTHTWRDMRHAYRFGGHAAFGSGSEMGGTRWRDMPSHEEFVRVAARSIHDALCRALVPIERACMTDLWVGPLYLRVVQKDRRPRNRPVLCLPRALARQLVEDEKARLEAHSARLETHSKAEGLQS
jgi:hypothetical protein